MWMLALGGVFLATAQACVLCHLSARDLSGRLAQLCSRVEVLWKDCGASWSFPAFALDEASMNKVIEKTHRVLRVMEIKGSLSSLPLYWRWLQTTKLPAYTREGSDAGREGVPGLSAKGAWLSGSPPPPSLSSVSALCAPACPLVPLCPAGGSTILYNCSTCQEFKVRCWPRKRCLPGSHDLREAKILLLSVLAAALLLGVVSLVASLSLSPCSGPVTWKQKGQVKTRTASQPPPVLKTTMNPLPSERISQPLRLTSVPRVYGHSLALMAHTYFSASLAQVTPGIIPDNRAPSLELCDAFPT
ncbi:hypothetical protein GH733_018653 [Mirounga leonina]|nr:hypothetical protein GH733_018653 [Mirounga leonina]